ncbi:flavodoxin family protein [Rhodococcus chondri]|uniref:Flavodoxin domain-containing protein n=1 Tax=Rhodococcus chondri TaxID=3065941 RepID=A0ABU7JUM6_9NOCA|nr:flavodoxin domain-containing protein [Rhodococcus sp. CC-R104]MEE2033720.1 flavodoxin domain-containing protein [Rhodococcus sp. CC-R104]
MQVLVVYESMYGNTRHVAEAIAKGIEAGATVKVVAAADAKNENLATYDLVVAGGPTHVHGMSRASTRHGAVEAAEEPDSTLTVEPDAESEGVREWLASLGSATGDAAAFDTRYDGPVLFTGRASKSIAKKLGKAGFTLIADPESFLVDKQTALEAGEEERASQWGRSLVQEKRSRS